MTTAFSQMIDKYQGVATTQVINAVSKAAEKTGVDFNFLMEKASTESSFDPKAKAKGSSATGLFQFIEQTWLGMVKRHGDKYGLGEYADKIEMKNGKACVTDCDVKKEILDLRKNPEISALMAGEFSAENKDFLEARTDGDVGSTELYMAHFMGAGGAAKFINCRDANGDATAADIFPKAAKANKSIFFDKQTGEARSLDDIYALFDKKFSGDVAAPATQIAAKARAVAPEDSAVSMNTRAHMLAMADTATRKLPVFDDENSADDIIWNDDPRFKSGFSKSNSPSQKLSPLNMMVMTQMQETLSSLKESTQYNS